MCGLAGQEAGIPALEVYRDMPIALVYAFEHLYLAKQGTKCRPVGGLEADDGELDEFHRVAH